MNNTRTGFWLVLAFSLKAWAQVSPLPDNVTSEINLAFRIDGRIVEIDQYVPAVIAGSNVCNPVCVGFQITSTNRSTHWERLPATGATALPVSVDIDALAWWFVARQQAHVHFDSSLSVSWAQPNLVPKLSPANVCTTVGANQHCYSPPLPSFGFNLGLSSLGTQLDGRLAVQQICVSDISFLPSRQIIANTTVSIGTTPPTQPVQPARCETQARASTARIPVDITFKELASQLLKSSKQTPTRLPTLVSDRFEFTRFEIQDLKDQVEITGYFESGTSGRKRGHAKVKGLLKWSERNELIFEGSQLELVGLDSMPTAVEHLARQFVTRWFSENLRWNAPVTPSTVQILFARRLSCALPGTPELSFQLPRITEPKIDTVGVHSVISFQFEVGPIQLAIPIAAPTTNCGTLR